MSVRFRSVKALEMSVRRRLPTLCQKKSTRRLVPEKRDPYTTSARPFRIGSRSCG